MKCVECNLYWANQWEDYPTCKADPIGPHLANTMIMTMMMIGKKRSIKK